MYERVRAPERLKFVLRKLEDMPYSDAGSLSGATGLSGVTSELRFVQKMLEKVHCVLINAQANWEDSKKSDPNVTYCISELEDVGICTETVILKLLDDVRSIKPGTFPDNLKKLNAKPVNLFALYRFKADIQNIKSRIERINTNNLGVPSDRPITQPTELSLCNVDDIWLPGFEIHRKFIIDRLLHPSLETRSVVLIGYDPMFVKTSFVKKIYQSTQVKIHFEVCFWLFPPIHIHKGDTIELLNPIDILRKMLLKLGDTSLLSAHDEDYLVSRLRQSLSGKRCLVVVDKPSELWPLVNSVFSHINNGSRLFLTYENRQWKETQHCHHRYKLPFLEKPTDRLKLPKELRKIYFKGLEDNETLSNMGDGNQSSSFLERVKQWYILGDKEPEELYIDWEKSYFNLPSVLKTCYTYTASVLPFYGILLPDSLIQLWIIEGIIPHKEGTTMENTAESYLEQLVQRGFLHIFGAYYHNQANHPIRSIILQHDLHKCTRAVNDGCFGQGFVDLIHVKLISSADEFDKYIDNKKKSPSMIRDHEKVRGLVLHSPYQFNQISSFEKGPILLRFHHPNLHSLFFFHYVEPVASPPFTFVRVLAVFSSHLRFPEEYAPCWLDELINLRYLGFIVCLVEGGSLGKTLDHLAKLEILDLSESFVSGLSEFIKNNKKVNVVGSFKEELPEIWSPVPDMCQ